MSKPETETAASVPGETTPLAATDTTTPPATATRNRTPAVTLDTVHEFVTTIENAVNGVEGEVTKLVITAENADEVYDDLRKYGSFVSAKATTLADELKKALNLRDRIKEHKKTVIGLLEN